MGSCSSVQRESQASMGFRPRLVSNAKRFFSASPAKEKHLKREEKKVHGFGVQSHDFAGGKEEIFFDARAWLESDCEDDFFSAYGDSASSRGSTPGRQLNAALTPRLDKTLSLEFPDLNSEQSPTGRKTLLELFSESMRHKGDGGKLNAPEERVKSSVMVNLNGTSAGQRPPKPSNGTLSNSGTSSVAHSNLVTPCSDLKIRKGRSLKTGHCCLPSLHASHPMRGGRR